MRTDAELLRAYDPDAFAEFYGRHATTVAAYLARRSRRPEVTFDLLGETFARAFEHRRHYEPRKGPAIAWLLAIARTVASEAERRGQVPDAARARLKIEPIALDDAALGVIDARSRVDFAATLSALPESQRIALHRRMVGEDDYFEDAPRPFGPSPHVGHQPPVKRGRDPFDLLGDQLFVAAGGKLARPRPTVLALVAAAVLLFGAGVAVAALTLGDDDKPRNGRQATPTPSPPPVITPNASPDPNNTNPFRRPSPRTPRATPQPAPVPPAQLDVTLTPDLTAGHAGWCVAMAINTGGVITGGRQCHRSGPPGTTLVAAGGMSGNPGMGYAVVDRAVRQVRLSDGRVLTPERAQGVPAGWRVAKWEVAGRPPTFTLHDRGGKEVAPRGSAAVAPLPSRRVPAADPPREPCAIRAKAGTNLRPRNARLLERFATLSLITPSYLSCASTSFRVGGRTLRAAVLLNPRDLDDPAPPLPSRDGLRVRRVGPGWLVVSGGTPALRARVLRGLSVTAP